MKKFPGGDTNIVRVGAAPRVLFTEDPLDDFSTIYETLPIYLWFGEVGITGRKILEMTERVVQVEDGYGWIKPENALETAPGTETAEIQLAQGKVPVVLWDGEQYRMAFFDMDRELIFPESSDLAGILSTQEVAERALLDALKRDASKNMHEELMERTPTPIYHDLAQYLIQLQKFVSTYKGTNKPLICDNVHSLQEAAFARWSVETRGLL